MTYVDVNKYKAMLPRRNQEFYMRNYKDLNKYEQEVLIVREVRILLNTLESDVALSELKGWGIDQLAVDLDCLSYMKDRDTARYKEMEENFVKALITEATYRVSGTSVPSDVVLRD